MKAFDSANSGQLGPVNSTRWILYGECSRRSDVGIECNEWEVRAGYELFEATVIADLIAQRGYLGELRCLFDDVAKFDFSVLQ